MDKLFTAEDRVIRFIVILEKARTVAGLIK